MDSVYLTPINAISLSLCVLYQAAGHEVLGILDNNEDAQGKCFRGVEIKPFSFISEVSATASVMVCSYRSERGINVQLMDLGVRHLLNYEDYVTSADENRLTDAFFSIQMQELREIAPFYETLHNVARLRIKQSLLPKHINNDKDALIIPILDLMITERCNLRCKNCSSLMQYFGNPRMYPMENIINGLTLLLNTIDYVRSIMIIGGEPFTHKELACIVDVVCKMGKVGTVTIPTNGAILPTDELCDKLSGHDNLLVTISDYGSLSKYKDKITERFDRYGISYLLLKEMTWYENALLVNALSRSTADMQETYRTCDYNCATLSEFLFSKCQTAMSLALLRAIPLGIDGEESTLNLLDGVDKSQISAHLNSGRAMTACRVCSGKSRYKNKRIPPAIQAKTPIPYERYE